MVEVTNIRDFVAEQRKLLELELEAQNEEETHTAGGSSKKTQDEEERPTHILGQLEVSDTSVGLYGHTP